MDMPLIDQALFNELQETAGADFVGELVETFAEEAPLLIEVMRAAVANGEADRFRRAAHSIKSNANAFGTTRLAENARTLELGGLPADGSSVEALSAELDLAIAALRERVRG